MEKSSDKLSNRKELPLPEYIRLASDDGEQAQISVRIPAGMKQQFEIAQETLLRHGRQMALADVVRDAIQRATEIVQHRFGHATGLRPDAGHTASSRPQDVGQRPLAGASSRTSTGTPSQLSRSAMVDLTSERNGELPPATPSADSLSEMGARHEKN